MKHLLCTTCNPWLTGYRINILLIAVIIGMSFWSGYADRKFDEMRYENNQ